MKKKLKQASRKQLEALAAALDSERETVLMAWYNSTNQATDVTTSAALTRLQFNDHIPLFLDALIERLQHWPEKASTETRRENQQEQSEHGLQRWQQGYHLPELICEWGYLQTALIEFLGTYALAHPELEPDVLPIAHKTLARLSTKSINTATEQYWRMHQAEAASHVQDLEQALATLQELEQLRANTWREAAHDLRGSMSVIEGSSSELSNDDTPEHLRHAFFDLMNQGLSSLQLILEDLMFLARLDAGHEQRELSTFNAAASLSEFCENARPLAQKRGLYLNLEGPDSLPVEGDRAKILRIVQNLLLNSLKYTRKGGVTVIWAADQATETNNWVFCVRDTGPGLEDASALKKDLAQATQVKIGLEQDASPPSGRSAADLKPALPRPGESGEGIGLSIVKRLCEVLDASLELETSPGIGSTFRVTLPRSYA